MNVNVRNIIVVGLMASLFIIVSKIIVNKYGIFQGAVQDTVNTI